MSTPTPSMRSHAAMERRQEKRRRAALAAAKRRKFTRSKDGVPRANLTVRVRLDQSQLETLAEYAAEKHTTLQDLLDTEVGLAVEGFIDQIEAGER
jgi:hypothetical protein